MKGVPGKPRKLTDAQVRQVRDWMPLTQLARKLGMTYRSAQMIREGYKHRRPSP